MPRKPFDKVQAFRRNGTNMVRVIAIEEQKANPFFFSGSKLDELQFDLTLTDIKDVRRVLMMISEMGESLPGGIHNQ